MISYGKVNKEEHKWITFLNIFLHHRRRLRFLLLILSNLMAPFSCCFQLIFDTCKHDLIFIFTFVMINSINTRSARLKVLLGIHKIGCSGGKWITKLLILMPVKWNFSPLRLACRLQIREFLSTVAIWNISIHRKKKPSTLEWNEMDFLFFIHPISNFISFLYQPATSSRGNEMCVIWVLYERMKKRTKRSSNKERNQFFSRMKNLEKISHKSDMKIKRRWKISKERKSYTSAWMGWNLVKWRSSFSLDISVQLTYICEKRRKKGKIAMRENVFKRIKELSRKKMILRKVAKNSELRFLFHFVELFEDSFMKFSVVQTLPHFWKLKWDYRLSNWARKQHDRISLQTERRVPRSEDHFAVDNINIDNWGVRRA